MIDPQVLALLGQLGIATPLIGILVMLLRAADAERRDITTKFLSTLESTIKANSEGGARISTAMAEMTKVVADRNTSATQEHQKMIELLQSIARDVERRREP